MSDRYFIETSHSRRGVLNFGACDEILELRDVCVDRLTCDRLRNAIRNVRNLGDDVVWTGEGWGKLRLDFVGVYPFEDSITDV